MLVLNVRFGSEADINTCPAFHPALMSAIGQKRTLVRHTPRGGVQMPDLDRNVRPCPSLRLIVNADKDVLGESDIHDALYGHGAVSILLRKEPRQFLNVRAALFPHCIGDSTGKCFDPVVVRLRAVDRSALLEPTIRSRGLFMKPIAKPPRQFSYCLFVVHVKRPVRDVCFGSKADISIGPAAPPGPMSANGQERTVTAASARLASPQGMAANVDAAHGRVCLFLILASAACAAEELPRIDPPEVLRGKVAAVVEGHARTIGCAVVVDAGHIVPYSLDRERVHIALYHADVGCSGGTAMGRPVLVVVRRGAYDTYFIDARYSAPQQTPGELAMSVTDLTVDHGHLVFTGLSLDVSDPLCCPSKVVRGRLRLMLGANPGWQVDF